jgi:hypothetical protein
MHSIRDIYVLGTLTAHVCVLDTFTAHVCVLDTFTAHACVLGTLTADVFILYVDFNDNTGMHGHANVLVWHDTHTHAAFSDVCIPAGMHRRRASSRAHVA